MTFCTMHATRPPPPSSLIQQCRPGTIAAHSTHPRQFSRACTASQHNFVTNFSTSGIRSPQNRRSKRRSSVVTYMGIRAIETYDSAFQLEPEAETKLKDLLRKPTFCAQVRLKELSATACRLCLATSQYSVQLNSSLQVFLTVVFWGSR